MNHVKLTFDIKSSNYSCPLGISLWHNDQCVFRLDHVVEPTSCSYSMDDTDQIHQIKITISGKKSEHTVVDQQGNIVSDVLLTLNNFALDGNCIDSLMPKMVEYHHNGNGFIDPVVDKFHHDVGCNGDLIFSFSSPVYLWLLEHL